MSSDPEMSNAQTPDASAEGNQNEKQKTCFIVSPIGDMGSEIRKRSDQVLKYIIKPVVEVYGYKTMRADQVAEPGMITTQIIDHVISDDLVIADLTGNNPNVFYELAIRHVIRKPFIQIVQKGAQLPFDIAPMRTIFFDHQDLDSVDTAKAEIAVQIEAIHNNPEIISPITYTLDVTTLRESSNADDRTLAELLTSVSSLTREVTALAKRIPQSPEPVETFPSWKTNTTDDGLFDLKMRIATRDEELRQARARLNMLTQMASQNDSASLQGEILTTKRHIMKLQHSLRRLRDTIESSN